MKRYFYEEIIKGPTKLIEELNDFHLNKPKVIAIDGHSGSGKSTIAATIAKNADAAVIPLDDFFSASIPLQKWGEFTIEEKLKNVFEWNRLREEVIIPLLKGQSAYWNSFDFATGIQSDGTYKIMDEKKKLIQEG